MELLRTSTKDKRIENYFVMPDSIKEYLKTDLSHMSITLHFNEYTRTYEIRMYPCTIEVYENYFTMQAPLFGLYTQFIDISEPITRNTQKQFELAKSKYDQFIDFCTTTDNLTEIEIELKKYEV